MPNKQQSKYKCHFSEVSSINLIPGQYLSEQQLEYKTALAFISPDGEGPCLPRGDFVYISLLQAHILTGIAKCKHEEKTSLGSSWFSQWKTNTKKKTYLTSEEARYTREQKDIKTSVVKFPPENRAPKTLTKGSQSLTSKIKVLERSIKN